MLLYAFHHLKALTYFLAIFNANFLVVHSRRRVFIGGMFSGSEHSTDSLQHVCENALKVVNNRSDILPGYELVLLPNDTKCNEGYGTRVLFEYLSRRPPIIMLLGAGCSSVTQTVAQTAWQWNLVQVSYTPIVADVSNQDYYPLLYRVAVPQSTNNAARLEFFKVYKWKRIATLVENDHELTQMMAGLHREMARQNFTLVASKSFKTDPTSDVRALKESSARVIVGMFREDKARRVFCEAYKLGMFGAKYVWFLLDWYDNQVWWLKKDRHVDCTIEQMTRATNGYFSIENMNPETNDKPGISGLTSQEVRSKLSTSNMFAPFAFDSVWVVALSLHKASEKLHLENKTLDSFSYKNKDMAKIIQTSLEGLSFQGATGRIKFNKQGDRIGPVRIKQLQNGVHTSVAVYYPSLEILTQNDTDQVMWQGSGPPTDAQHPMYQTEYIHWTLFWFIIALTSLGVILSSMFLAFNIKYRHNSNIKLSSPYLNNVTIAGALLIYASVYSSVLDTRVIKSKVLPYMCSITAFLLGIGYSLMFGAMFSKTWRVHQVLNKVHPKRKFFKCSELIGLVLILVVMDCIVFSLWTSLDPFTINVKTTNRKIHSQSSEPIIYQYEYCHSKHMITWYYVIFGYKGLMLLVGCFVAWETRDFKVRSLNDSRSIGIGIFTITLAVFIGVPLTFLIAEHRNAYIAILSLSLILPTTISLCLIFVPKISKMKKQPEDSLRHQPLTVMRAAQEYSNRAVEPSKDDLGATIVRLQVDLATVKKELSDQKALNASVRPVDKHRYDDEVDVNTPRSSRKPLAVRSNTCMNIKDGSNSNQHRRCNTFSASHPPNGHVTQDSHVEDLKVENESLRQKLRQTKINEAGKMCKVLYENAELNRKVAELSMKQTPRNESDTMSRLMKENNELKRQLGEVSILNSVWCDVTPKLKRKGTTDNKYKKDLKELQHLLTVDLGGGRAGSFGVSRTRRPPTIGQSQSSLNLLDSKDTHQEVVGERHDKEEKQTKVNDEGVAAASDEKLNDDTTKLEEETKRKDEKYQVVEDDVEEETQAPFEEDKFETKLDENSNIQQGQKVPTNSYKPVSSSENEESSLKGAENKGFVDEEPTISGNKLVDDTDVFVPEKEQKTENKPEKQFDKIWTAKETSNTRELLKKGKVRLRSQTNYSTYDDDEHDYRLRRTLSADCNPNNSKTSHNKDPRSLSVETSTRTRTVIGSDNSDSGVDSAQLSPQHHTEYNAEERTGNKEYPIQRKQRKSKRDKKAKVEKVEKTFFV